MRKAMFGLAVMAALAACVQAPLPSPMPAPPAAIPSVPASPPAAATKPAKPPAMSDGPDECGMVSVQNYVGQPVAKFDALQWTQHPYRVIRPNEGVTMDFNPERLNVWADDGDNITRLSCG